MSFKQVQELRKRGQLNEAYRQAVADFKQNDDSWAASALFWVLRDLAERELDQGRLAQAARCVARLERLQPRFDHPAGPDDGREHGLTHRTGLAWAYCRLARACVKQQQAAQAKPWLLKYMALKRLPRPSGLHSSIMQVAVEVDKAIPQDFKFTAFLQLWGFDDFMDDDWVEGQKDGKRFNSLVEKAIGRYFAELKADAIKAVPQGFEALLNQAAATYRWKPVYAYRQGRLMLMRGDRAGALQVFLGLTRRIKLPFIWKEIAQLADDPKLKKAALCQYISRQRSDNFVGRLHLDLAAILIADGNPAAALSELNTYAATARRAGRHLSPTHARLLARIPAGTVATAGNRRLYQQAAQWLTARALL